MNIVVEMRVAPFRALTLLDDVIFVHGSNRRNEGRPFQGIDTHFTVVIELNCVIVEMRVAPFRALTHCLSTTCACARLPVEMRVAPFRALTHTISTTPARRRFGRNEGRPFQGIDTRRFRSQWHWSGIGRNEGRPFQGIDTLLILSRFIEPVFS